MSAWAWLLIATCRNGENASTLATCGEHRAHARHAGRADRHRRRRPLMVGVFVIVLREGK